MARPLRLQFEGALYHVTGRGNEKKKTFFTQTEYEKFRKYLQEAKVKFNALFHAYVLMSNHYHLIIETPDANLNKIMHYLNGSYTTYLNTKRKRSGHLFQGRYKAILLERDSHLLELTRYLHLNPVRAGLAPKPDQYPYSSYGAYISKKDDDLISRDLVLGMISTDQSQAIRKYKDFVEAGIGKDLTNPLAKVYAGMIAGGNQFIQDVLQRIDGQKVAKKEVSFRKALKSSVDLKGVIVEALCSYYGITREEFFRKKGIFRNLGIYLLKKHTSLSNRDIGRLFNDISFSAVTQASTRLIKKMAEDKNLKKEVAGIEGKLSNVKG
jgi:putative transposase